MKLNRKKKCWYINFNLIYRKKLTKLRKKEIKESYKKIENK